MRLHNKFKICEKHYVPANKLKEAVTFVCMILQYNFHVFTGVLAHMIVIRFVLQCGEINLSRPFGGKHTLQLRGD